MRFLGTLFPWVWMRGRLQIAAEIPGRDEAIITILAMASGRVDAYIAIQLLIYLLSRPFS